MRNTFDHVALCVVCLLCLPAVGGCGDDDDPGDAAGSGGSSGRSGSGGNPSAGVGGRSAGTAAGGAGRGAAGRANAGTGGRGGTGAAGEASDLDAGPDDDAGPTGGTAASGSGGSGGSAGQGDQVAAQCVTDSMAAGQTITDCERCLCQTGVCQAEMNAIKDDVNANALVKCSQQNTCSGECCICGEVCDDLGQNYGNGPCRADAERAAGTTVGGGLPSAIIVATNCAEDAATDNSCRRAARLSACALDKCAAMCPNLPACTQ